MFNVVLHFITGTGKTTTLLEYALLRPNVKFLLIVYNKYVYYFLNINCRNVFVLICNILDESYFVICLKLLRI